MPSNSSAEYKGSSTRRKGQLRGQFAGIAAIEATAEGRPYGRAEKARARGAEAESAEFLALLHSGYSDASPPIPGLTQPEYDWYLQNRGARVRGLSARAPAGTTGRSIMAKVQAIRTEQVRRSTPHASPESPARRTAPVEQRVPEASAAGADNLSKQVDAEIAEMLRKYGGAQ